MHSGTAATSASTAQRVLAGMWRARGHTTWIGIGSALSVLLFLTVLLLAFLITKLFRVDLAQARGEG